MIHIIECLRDKHQNDLIKYFRDCGDFQGVLLFIQETKDNIRDSDWYFHFQHYNIMDGRFPILASNLFNTERKESVNEAFCSAIELSKFRL